jgi:hypothetical protein
MVESELFREFVPGLLVKFKLSPMYALVSSVLATCWGAYIRCNTLSRCGYRRCLNRHCSLLDAHRREDPDLPSRAEVIRRLCAKALTSSKPAKPRCKGRKQRGK